MLTLEEDTEGPEGEQKCSFTLSLTSAQERGLLVNATPQAALSPRERDPAHFVQEVGWAPGPVCTGAENVAPPTGIRSLDRPGRSESGTLYF
jgi:hypothetical protein